nr:embryo sac development arrest 7 [Tanacetum cinerariifolium]
AYMVKRKEFEANKKDIETLDAKKPSKKKRGLTVHISFRELSFRYVNMFRKDGDHDRYKECTYVLLEGVLHVLMNLMKKRSVHI